MPEPHDRSVRTPGSGLTPTGNAAATYNYEAEPTDVTPAPNPTPDASTARGRKVRRVALGALLAAGLAGVAGIGTVGWSVFRQTGAELHPPEHVAGLSRDDSKRARDLSEYLRTVLNANVDLTESTSVVYADPNSRNQNVLLFGGTALLWRPERTLDEVFTVVAGDSASVHGLREFPAGQLGGVLKCARATSPDGGITMCGWADHGTIALGMFPGRNVQDAASVLLRIREATQTRR